ncbi:MAG: hypothetical protein IMW99_07495 [Firmicutes bacterium]|nr:hypothetical protein [Bacillota bacterium]
MEQERPEPASQSESYGYGGKYGYGPRWGGLIPPEIHELWHLYTYAAAEAADVANLHRAIYEAVSPDMKSFFEMSLRDETGQLVEICMLAMKHDPAFRDAMMRRMRPMLEQS